MSKRSEIAAMVAYPILYRTFCEPDIHYEADVNKAPRAKFKEGYEQAVSDVLSWLDSNRTLGPGDTSELKSEIKAHFL